MTRAGVGTGRREERIAASDSQKVPLGSRGVGIAAGAASLALFAFTVCPTVPFGDGGDLIVASAELGVAHPPGYPLYTLLGRLALAVPFGEPALRMNLLSALFGALACALAAGFVHRRTGSAAAGIGAGLGFAASATFWSVATVAEVYTLHLLLVVSLLEAGARAGEAGSDAVRGRALVAAGAFFGLGLAHHPTVVLAAPSAVLLAWRGRRARVNRPVRAPWRHRLIAAGLLTFIPAILHGTLLVRARLAEGPAWGRPATLDGLLSHASAAAYRFHDLGWAGLGRPEGWAGLGRLALEDGAHVAVPLAFFGLLLATERVRFRLPGALVLLVASSSLFYLRYSTEDAEVYFLPASLGLALLAGLGVAAVEARAGGWGRAAGAAAAAILAIAPLAAHYPSRNLRGMTAAARYGRDVLAAVPPGGVLFVEGDDAFVLAYLTRVLRERPEVTLYDRKGQVLRDLLQEPGSPRRARETPGAYRNRREIELLEVEAAKPSPRPVLFLIWPGYELPEGRRFEPVGLVYEVRRAADPPRDDGLVWAAMGEGEVVREALRVGGSFALAVAATYPLMRGERALFLGETDRALASFEEASRIAGESETVHNTLGAIFGRRGDYARAIREFEAAIRAKPVSIRAWNNLGYARFLVGDWEGAGEAYRRSLALDPRQEEAIWMLQLVGGAP